jgi:hypothetical protein
MWKMDKWRGEQQASCLLRRAGSPFHLIYGLVYWRGEIYFQDMKQQEIAEILRKEVGELEVSIKKVQARCDRLKRFVLNLEDELNPTRGEPPKSILDGKFREMVDKVFGEKPKRKAKK